MLLVVNGYWRSGVPDSDLIKTISHLPVSTKKNVTFVNIMPSSDFIANTLLTTRNHLSIQQMAEDVKSLGASFVLF